LIIYYNLKKFIKSIILIIITFYNKIKLTRENKEKGLREIFLSPNTEAEIKNHEIKVIFLQDYAIIQLM